MSMPSQQDRNLFDSSWGRLEKVVERFEDAWQSGPRPSIDEYLSSGGAPRQKLIVELAHVDLECRLKAGEAIRAEEYLSRYAELSGDQAQALRLIEAEYRLRRRLEPGLEVDEYLGRFPQHRQDLEQLLRGPHIRSGLSDPTPSPAWPEKTPRADIPPRLGHFELLETIGQGAFGTVYRARDTELGRIVAVKVPRLDQSCSSADLDRFLREARSTAALSHPGIVPVYEVGQAGNSPYIVSAFVEGMTLAQTLARQRLDFRAAAQVVAQVAEALEHAHQSRVVHRDLKPSNIMLGRIQGSGIRNQATETGGPESVSHRLDTEPASAESARQAFVMDFGLAWRDEGQARLTIEGQLLGTPAYMSPEQARGQNQNVDGRTDVYGLGVILYELLTGEVPFRGVARMVLQQIMHEEPRSPRRLNDRTPRDLETIALKCLAKEPGRRYATAAALAADLRRYLNGVPILARPVGPIERAWRWAKRNPRVASLSAAVVLLLGVVAIGSGIAAVVINHRRQEAVDAGVAERQARAAADESLRTALDALEKLVYEVDDQLRDQPAAFKLRENLLEAAVEGLQRVARGTQGAPDHRLARAHERLGAIFLTLRNFEEAQTHLEHWRTIAESLALAEPQDPKSRRSLCVATAKLGNLALASGNMRDARTHCAKALELAIELPGGRHGGVEGTVELALCQNLIGRLSLQLDDAERAAACHRQAIELLDKLLAAEPTSTMVLQPLANYSVNLAEACLRAGDVPAAHDNLNQAQKHYRDWLAAEPKSVPARRDLAVAFEKLGDMHRADDPSTAEKNYQESLRLRQELAAADPYNPVRRRDLSMAYLKIGIITDKLGDAQAARGHYRKSLNWLEEMESANPKDKRARRDVAATHLRLGNINLHLGDIATALEHLSKARSRFETLAAISKIDQAQLDLVAVYDSLGDAQKQAHSYEEAVSFFDKSLAILATLDKKSKLKGQAREWFTEQQEKQTFCKSAEQAVRNLEFVLKQSPEKAKELLVVRSRALAARGEHDDAADAAAKLRQLAPTNSATLFDVARCQALCVFAVARGKAPDRLTLAEAQARTRYINMALESLAEAVENGFRDLRRLESDPDLDAIRPEKQYIQLVQRLKKE